MGAAEQIRLKGVASESAAGPRIKSRVARKPANRLAASGCRCSGELCRRREDVGTNDAETLWTRAHPVCPVVRFRLRAATIAHLLPDTGEREWRGGGSALSSCRSGTAALGSAASRIIGGHLLWWECGIGGGQRRGVRSRGAGSGLGVCKLSRGRLQHGEAERKGARGRWPCGVGLGEGGAFRDCRRGEESWLRRGGAAPPRPTPPPPAAPPPPP